MDQAAVLDGLYFDLLPFCQDCRAAPKVDVGGCQIAEAFVISAMVVMLDEGVDGRSLRWRVSDLLCMSDPVHASPKGSMNDHLERNPRRTAEGRGAP